MKKYLSLLLILGLMTMLSFGSEFSDIKKDISVSIGNTIGGSPKKTALQRYTEMSACIRDGKIGNLTKLLKNPDYFPAWIQYTDVNGNIKTKAYDDELGISENNANRYALKKYNSLFTEAVVNRDKIGDKDSEKALNALYGAIKNRVKNDVTMFTLRNLLIFYSEEDFEFFYNYIKKNKELNSVYDKHNNIVSLITFASSEAIDNENETIDFLKDKTLDLLINEYLRHASPVSLVKDVIVANNKLPKYIFNKKKGSGIAIEFKFNFQNFYKHLEQQANPPLTIEDKCNFMTDVMNLWRDTSQTWGNVYVDDLFVDTFNIFLDSLDLTPPPDARKKYSTGAVFQWKKADFDTIIHDACDQFNSYFYYVRDAEKEPWSKLFESKYGFEKTTLFVPLEMNENN